MESLNFDKTKKQLVIRLSNGKILEIDMSVIRYFIFNNSGNDMVFHQLPGRPRVYALELFAGPEYTIYKSVSTKFRKADYVNKGVYESGYDTTGISTRSSIISFRSMEPWYRWRRWDAGDEETWRIPALAKKYFEKNPLDESNPDKSMKGLAVFLNANAVSDNQVNSPG